jgi:hypothetical protein
MRNAFVVFALCLLTQQFAIGQVGPTEITNSDIITMTKAGIGEQTIILAIQRGHVMFDTSPQALVSLKSGGVSDQVLNAMLASDSRKSQIGSDQQPTKTKSNLIGVSSGSSDVDRVVSFRRGCESGDMDACANLGFYYGMGWGVSKDSSEAAAFFKKACDGGSSNGCHFQKANTSSTLSGSSQTENPNENGGPAKPSDAERAATFKRGCDSGGLDACVNLAIDYRMGWGVSKDLSQAAALLKKACDGGNTNGCHFQEAAKSSTLQHKQSDIQAQNRSQGLTLRVRVLQEQSVPYTQESGGGISTRCNIVGTSNTSAYANTLGNSTFGNATTSSNQHMSCNTYDTTIRWPHVLNVMFAEASDGNSYMFACDRAWRWSKCVPLRAGQVFNARFTDKGLEVEAFSTKGKEETPTYHVLQSKSLR